MKDELLLCATLLDARNGFDRELSIALLKKEKHVLMERLKDMYQVLNASQHAKPATYISIRNAGSSVATARTSSLGAVILPNSAAASIIVIDLEKASTTNVQTNTPEKEVVAIFKAVSQSEIAGNWKSDSMDLYRDQNAELNLHVP